MQYRDRIRELRRVPAAVIQANPKNWRLHPERQRKAMQQILERVGYADALIAREDDDGELVLIDGHLRTDISGDDLVPVLVLDVDEQEADEILATMDPLGKLADADEFLLESLLTSLASDSEITGLLETIGDEYGLDLDLGGLGTFDLDPDAEADSNDDFALVQYIIQVPKYKSDQALEDAIRNLADNFGVNFRIHGVK